MTTKPMTFGFVSTPKKKPMLNGKIVKMATFSSRTNPDGTITWYKR